MELEPGMRVVVSPSDESGCGHYRCFYPSKALELNTHVDVEMIPRVLDRLDLRNPGVIVLQRPVHQKIADVTIPYLRSQGWAIVVEIDDNLSHLHPTHFAFHTYHPRNKESNWKALEACARQADLVTCTTPDLARQYASHGRYSVIPNYVPEAAVLDEVPQEPEEKLFGWAGVLASHPGDLDIARKAIVRGNQTDGWRFAGLGDPAITRYLGVDGVDLPGTASVEDWLPALSQLQVGLVPLAGHRFNEGKSYLKGLEYAARGIPFIASSTGPYCELENEGAGVTVFTQKEWVRGLQNLMQDYAWRRDLAEAGLVVARENTYEKNAWRWAEAWCQARRNFLKNITQSEIASGRLLLSNNDLMIR